MQEIAQFFLFLAGLLPLGLNDLPQISISWHNDSHCSLTLECILSYLHFIAFCCSVLLSIAALLLMAAQLELRGLPDLSLGLALYYIGGVYNFMI